MAFRARMGAGLELRLDRGLGGRSHMATIVLYAQPLQITSNIFTTSDYFLYSMSVVALRAGGLGGYARQGVVVMDAGILLARIVIGPLMAAHGAQKLLGWFGGYGLTGTGGYFEGIGFRPGKRFGPREIRSFSVRYSAWGGHKPNGYWDVNQRKRFLSGVSMVDCGDVDIAYYGIERNMRLITESVTAILARKALPVLLGGDHSVSFPIVQAFGDFAPLDIVHVDAHLDFIDDVDVQPLRPGLLCDQCGVGVVRHQRQAVRVRVARQPPRAGKHRAGRQHGSLL